MKLVVEICSRILSTSSVITNNPSAGSMLPSEACYNLIKQFEGCRLTAYQDTRGIWTIGYGATGLGIGPGVVWTQAQADWALSQRVEAVGRIICQAVVPSLLQNQFDALCSLVYNIGPGAFRGSTLLRLLNQRDFQGAAQQFMAWDHAGRAVIEGLARRRQAEMTLFASNSLL